jgi:hypothetical protein
MLPLSVFLDFTIETSTSNRYDAECRDFDKNYAILQTQPKPAPDTPCKPQKNLISLAVAQQKAAKRQHGRLLEFDAYLKSGTTFDVYILAFWRSYEARAQPSPRLYKMSLPFLWPELESSDVFQLVASYPLTSKTGPTGTRSLNLKCFSIIKS